MEDKNTKLTDYRSRPKWHNAKEVKRLQKEWNQKLKELGFEDIEGGVEGHLLSGPKSTKLEALSSIFHVDKKDAQYSPPDDYIDADEELVEFSQGEKARYYHHAQMLAAQAFREGLPAQLCYIWALSSQGLGERQVAELMGIKRGAVRKYTGLLRRNARLRLDNLHV